MPIDFLFLSVDPDVSLPGVVAGGVSDAAVVLAMGLPAPTEGVSLGEGVDRPKFLPTGGDILSESTTSEARPKICHLPTNPSISAYMASLNSSGIFLVFDNCFFRSLLIPHQLAEHVPSIYSLSFL